MATPDSGEPGIYEFVKSSGMGTYRKWTGEKWMGSSESIRGAAVRTSSSFSQSFYTDRIAEAISVTLVADLAGNPHSAQRPGPEQLDLFQ